MKTIKAHILGNVVVVNPKTPTELELNEVPAYKNWDKLRSLGYAACKLISKPEEVIDPDFINNMEIHWHLPENDMEKLEIEIATYDWFYEMSDDHGVYRRGRDKDYRIQALTQKVDKKIYIELWTAYVYMAAENYVDPDDFKERYLKRVQ